VASSQISTSNIFRVLSGPRKSQYIRRFAVEFAAAERERERDPKEREMGFVGDTVESIRSMQIRQVFAQIISLGETPCLNLPLVSLSMCLALASRRVVLGFMV
jgi:hypothetical protein